MRLFPTTSRRVPPAAPRARRAVAGRAAALRPVAASTTHGLSAIRRTARTSKGVSRPRPRASGLMSQPTRTLRTPQPQACRVVLYRRSSDGGRDTGPGTVCQPRRTDRTHRPGLPRCRTDAALRSPLHGWAPYGLGGDRRSVLRSSARLTDSLGPCSLSYRWSAGGEKSGSIEPGVPRAVSGAPIGRERE
jgi:hypothetical protein